MRSGTRLLLSQRVFHRAGYGLYLFISEFRVHRQREDGVLHLLADGQVAPLAAEALIGLLQVQGYRVIDLVAYALFGQVFLRVVALGFGVEAYGCNS